TTQFGAAFDLFRRRERTPRSSRRRAAKIWQGFRSQEIQRPGYFLRQSAGKIRSRADGIVRLVRYSPRRRRIKKQALGTSASTTHIRAMPKLATWLRVKDEKWFQLFFAKYPEIEICNARNGEIAVANVDGLLLTGGADIAPELLKQPVPDPSVLDPDVDVARDRWEFAAVNQALAR